MLSTLVIKNFALIENQTIEFKKGFNVLVGETGAGKSLILDALAFVLGEKSNKLNLRNGTQKMFVQAVFEDVSSLANQLLEDNGVEVEDNIIVSRVFTLDGKTECRINGVIVPVAVVKNLANLLVDTCSQNENTELLKVKNHLAILDKYAENEILPLKQQILQYTSNLAEIHNQMQSIGGSKQNREREIELLEYQIKDIENANLKIGEDEEIKNKINILSNYEKIFDNLKLAQENLASAVESLSVAKSALENADKFNDSLIELHNRLDSVKIEIEDIEETIVDKLSSMEFDSNELENLDARLEEIKLIKKKYGFKIEDVFAYLDKIKQDYDNYLFGEEKLLKLERQYNDLKKELYAKCKQLSELRRNVALSVEENVMNELKFLGFKNATFKVHFDDLPNLELAAFNKNGLDNVEFLFSANAGQELKSLSKTISGGEMSRFMLALKNVFAKCFNTSVLIFDEVDTGISGEIGQKVAERLAMLSRSYQLICITHLCQVTAMADNYVFVQKEVLQNETFTKISYLKGDELTKYIAIVSGAQPTDVAMRFAKELKEKAEQFKATLH